MLGSKAAKSSTNHLQLKKFLFLLSQQPKSHFSPPRLTEARAAAAQLSSPGASAVTPAEQQLGSEQGLAAKKDGWVSGWMCEWVGVWLDG